MPIDFEQNGRVAKPGHPQPRGWGRREARWLDRSGARPRPRLHVGVGPEQGNDCGPRVVHDRLRILEVRALPLGGLPHPLEPGTSRASAEGGTVRKRACGDRRHPGGDEPPSSPTPPCDPWLHFTEATRPSLGCRGSREPVLRGVVLHEPRHPP